VLIAELQRSSSHRAWFGTHAMEVGAITGLLYAMREREQLMNLNELMAGFRFFPSFIRVGGLREDIPRGFKEACKAFLDRFPQKLDEYETLITKNPIWMDRTRGVGVISCETAASGACSVRSRAPPEAVRRAPCVPVSATTLMSSTSSARRTATSTIATSRDRGDARRQDLQPGARPHRSGRSLGRQRQAHRAAPKDQVYTEMEALIQHFLIYSQGFNVPAGDAYVPVEGPRGEHGCYVVSDGTNRPWRVHMRAPGLFACQALHKFVVGGMIADVIAVIGSLDVVMGDVDR
jgi:NADH-quinone oxidoreductase subunit D